MIRTQLTCETLRRGFFGKGDMQKEFEEAAFNLEKGEVSGIVQTASGVHLIERCVSPSSSHDNPWLVNAIPKSLEADREIGWSDIDGPRGFGHYKTTRRESDAYDSSFRDPIGFRVLRFSEMLKNTS